MDSIDTLKSALQKIKSHYQDTNKIISSKMSNFSKSPSVIELFGKIQDMMHIICGQLDMVLEREERFVDKSNFDPRGTWGVVTRILNRLIQRIRVNILSLNEFKSHDRTYSFSFKRKEHLALTKLNEIFENVHYASKCLVRLAIITEHGNLFDESNIKDYLESAYSYPFWYTV